MLQDNFEVGVVILTHILAILGDHFLQRDILSYRTETVDQQKHFLASD